MHPATTNRRLLPLVVITGLTLAALDASGFGPIAGMRRGALVASAPLVRLADAVTDPVVGAWNGAFHHGSLIEENRRLRQRLAEAEGRLVSQPDLALELQALREAVDIAGIEHLDRVTARVVADRRTDVDRIVELDKGAHDGLAPGMPVVTGQGLVGVVDDVIEDRSIIRLLTDTRTAVGVRTPHGVGLVIGRPDGGLAIEPGPALATALDEARVATGQRLVTSGTERSRYPPGLPVARLVGRPDGSWLVEPEADLDVLGYVTVLLVARAA